MTSPPTSSRGSVANKNTARPRAAASASWLLPILPLLLFVISLTLGRYDISVGEVARVLLSPLVPGIAGDVPEVARKLVLLVRVPRALAALMIGASLSVTGAAFQGIFKNPLVDSNILGVTSGAGFGAALAILVMAPGWQVQLSAFIFGLAAVSLAFAGSRMYRSSPVLVLTLMGILIGSLFSSLTSLLKYVADPLDTLPAITFWLLGSLTDVTWSDLPGLAAITIGGGVLLVLVRWRLNILSLGEDEAVAGGIDPARLKVALIVIATLMTAMAVSVSGVIGWVGLVMPHAGRIIVGPDHKRLIPASISLGGAFLLIIDTVARTAFAGEVPLGVLTGLIGVPLLIILLRRKGMGW